MSEFDEWFKNRHTKTGLYEEALCGKDNATYIRHEMRKAYKAGQQSQQAKIELLETELTETQAFLNKQNHIKQAKINKLQARINVYELHINTLKNIHDCDFNEQSESSYILGNLDGFFECVESDLKEIQNNGEDFNFKGKPNEL